MNAFCTQFCVRFGMEALHDEAFHWHETNVPLNTECGTSSDLEINMINQNCWRWFPVFFLLSCMININIIIKTLSSKRDLVGVQIIQSEPIFLWLKAIFKCFCAAPLARRDTSSTSCCLLLIYSKDQLNLDQIHQTMNFIPPPVPPAL